MSVLVGNLYDKYHSRNPIVVRLMRHFLSAMTRSVRGASPTSLLEVGCGEGHLTYHLWKELGAFPRYAICDLSLERLRSDLDPSIERHTASIYELPYRDHTFDLVVCSEVLEHLERPELALAELCRVSAQYLLVSTPQEPLFRLLNVLRGAYWSDFGNTPGHLQHFSVNKLLALLEGRLQILEISTPIPWIVAFCRLDSRENRRNDLGRANSQPRLVQVEDPSR